MNKKVVFGVIGVLIVLLIAIVVIFSNKTNAPSVASNQSQTKTMQEVASAPTTQVAPTPGAYIAYNVSAVATDKNTKILFFHAPWCPQCRALDADITKNIANDTNVTIYKVDYDTNQDLRKKYGVTLQTTLVKVDDNGNLVKKYVAYQDPTYANVKANVY